jgi:hypothetical protein
MVAISQQNFLYVLHRPEAQTAKSSDLARLLRKPAAHRRCSFLPIPVIGRQLVLAIETALEKKRL